MQTKIFVNYLAIVEKAGANQSFSSYVVHISLRQMFPHHLFSSESRVNTASGQVIIDNLKAVGKEKKTFSTLQK